MAKVLVAYFSASGNTAKLAETLAKAVDGDLHEIIPEEPYTEEDLDWMNQESRSSREMNNKAFRPEIANVVKNIEQYDTIYLGFPIWWYVAPTIINAFLEQYSLVGKNIVPFATSGSSGMGSTVELLKGSCPGANLLNGKRFSVDATEQELRKWAEGLKFF